MKWHKIQVEWVVILLVARYISNSKTRYLLKIPKRKLGQHHLWSFEFTVAKLLRTKQVGNNANPKALTLEPQLVDLTQMFLPLPNLTPRSLRFEVLLGIRYLFIN